MTVNIYRIYSHIGDLQYFGSTMDNIIRRYRVHVQKYNIKINPCKSNVLFDTYGTVNTFVELLETCEKDNRKEREGWWIRNHECVNKAIPDRTRLEYHEKTRDINNTRKREAYEKNRDAINARTREYREKNRDAVNARRRESRALKKASDA